MLIHCYLLHALHDKVMGFFSPADHTPFRMVNGSASWLAHSFKFISVATWPHTGCAHQRTHRGRPDRFGRGVTAAGRDGWAAGEQKNVLYAVHAKMQVLFYPWDGWAAGEQINVLCACRCCFTPWDGRAAGEQIKCRWCCLHANELFYTLRWQNCRWANKKKIMLCAWNLAVLDAQ